MLTPDTTAFSGLARDLEASLFVDPKRIPCRWLYDANGSRLFERICESREYYLWRAEDSLLRRHSARLAARIGRVSEVFELGCGNAMKTARLLAPLSARNPDMRYRPVDFSRAALDAAAGRLGRLLPGLKLAPIQCDYEEALAALDRDAGVGRVVLWLGSSIGNMAPGDALLFLKRLGAKLAREDRVILGFDLKKERAILEGAYNDAEGLTAAFNLNLLARINRELGGRFALERFRHHAAFNEREGRIEMRLVSRIAQDVPIDALGRVLKLGAGEAIHTEDCYKYSVAEFESLGGAAGLRLDDLALDERRWFALAVFARP